MDDPNKVELRYLEGAISDLAEQIYLRRASRRPVPTMIQMCRSDAQESFQVAVEFYKVRLEWRSKNQ
jgi:hypothetical protein